MSVILAHTGKELYRTEIKSATHTIISDEPESNTGKDLGFAPKELLAASLAACTSITLRMYANRKGWDLTDVKVEVTLDTDPMDNKFKIQRTIQLLGTLDNDQKARLMTIADKCPIHKILTNPIEITTDLDPNSKL
jgi:putative redox protein